MKTPVLLAVLFFVVGVSAWSYHHKFRDEKDEIDRLELALEGIKDIVPIGSTISFAGADITVRSQSRYVLAPAIVLADNKDTALVMYPLPDSTMPGGNILWQNTDNRYEYYITTGNAE